MKMIRWGTREKRRRIKVIDQDCHEDGGGGGDYKSPFEYAMWREETLQLLKLGDDGRYGDGKYWANEQWGVRSGNSKLLDDFAMGRR